MNDRELTVYQRQYYAWQLTRRMAGDNPDLLTPSLAGSQVDLNPHQIEAALFACRNPLAMGVILADEVGQAAERWPNLTLKKIPKMVLVRCEWGHDDYSLNVAALPMFDKPTAEPATQPLAVDRKKKAQVAPGQGGLFAEDEA